MHHADDVRRAIKQRTGNQWWADRLVPVLPEDIETLPRAQMLWGSLQQRWQNPATDADSTSGLVKARQTVLGLQSQLQAVMPRFQELMGRPGAAEIRAELTRGLAERSLARAIKLVFNQNQPAADAGRNIATNMYLPNASVQRRNVSRI